MGLFDFLKKGEQKPTAKPQPKPAAQAPRPQAAPAQAQAQPPAQPAGPRYEMYTVKEGDWLSKIAGKYYGDVHKWSKIYDANRDQINDPDKIKPGMILKIPLE